MTLSKWTTAQREGMDLDVDRDDVDPLKSHGIDARDHRPLAFARTAGAEHTPI
jgi:hypothetical protein